MNEYNIKIIGKFIFKFSVNDYSGSYKIHWRQDDCLGCHSMPVPLALATVVKNFHQ